MADDLNDLVKPMPPLQATQQPTLDMRDQAQPSYIGGFLESAASSVLENFGAEPTPGAEAFNTNNPWAGMGAGVLGIGGSYGAYLKAINKMEKMNNLIKAAGEVSDNKLISGAAENITRFAPFEAARVGVTAATNPENTGDVAGSAGINLGIEGALGMGGALLKTGGRVLSAADKAKTDLLDLKEPPQVQIRTLKEKLTNGEFPPEQASKVNYKIKDLESAIRLETVGVKDFTDPTKTRIVRKAIGDLEQGDAGDINRLFKEEDSASGAVRRARLIFSPGAKGGFQSRGELTRVVQAAGLEGQWEHVSLPRYVGFGKQGGKQEASKIEKDFIDRGLFTQIDDNVLMGKEKDGLYVMAKKITGTMGKGETTDEWVIFKTGRPGNFVESVQSFVDKQTERLAFRREPLDAPTGNPMLQVLDQAMVRIQQTPMTNYLIGLEKGMFGRGMNAGRKVFGLPEAAPGSSFIASRMGAFVDDYLTPNLYQWTSSPRAKWIFGHAKAINEDYRRQADEILFGEYKAAKGSLVTRALSDPGTTGKTAEGTRSLQSVVNEMEKGDISSAIRASEYLVDLSDDMASVPQHIDGLLSAGEINPKVAEFLHVAHQHDVKIMSQIAALQEQIGLKPFEPLAGHVMLSRTWEGNYRSFVLNETGDKVYVAGGKTPDVADARARAIVAEAEKQGTTGLRIERADDVDAAKDIEFGKQIKFKSEQFKTLSRISRELAREPGKPMTMLKERTGMDGFQTDFTPKEFMDKLRNHTNERFKYMSKVTRQFLLGADMQRLLETDPKIAKSVMARFEDLDGEAGILGKMQNKATDRVLGPHLGGNSASKIVDTVNEYQYHMNFGAFNLAFPAINALTFIQTVAPEVAMVMNLAGDVRLGKYYDGIVAVGSDNRPRGLMGALSPAKLTMQAMKEMSKPGKDLEAAIDWALSNGVIDPKLTAEFVGDTAKFKTTLKDVTSGKDGWVNLIKTVSTYLPEKSERLARTHAFTTGFIMARDLLKIQDPKQQYRIAQQFTQRTMYGYKTVDRPQIFTSPLGRTFGLFKNWQAHYISTMAQYAGEFNQGNMAPLMWQMAGTGAVGGLVGTPLFGVADAASKLFSDKTLMQNYYQAFGNSDPNSPMGNVHDAVFWGLPSFLGITMSGNVSAPGADPARDAAGLMSFPQWQRASDLGAAVGDAFDVWATTGKHPGMSKDVMEKFALATLPKTFQRYISDTQNEVVSLRSGKIQASGLSDYEMMLHKFGFTPKRLGIQQRVQRELWNDQNKLKQEITTMGTIAAEAMRGQDWDALTGVMRTSLMKGIPFESVMRSANTHNQKREKDLVKTQFEPLKLQPYKDLGLIE